MTDRTDDSTEEISSIDSGDLDTQSALTTDEETEKAQVVTRKYRDGWKHNGPFYPRNF